MNVKGTYSDNFISKKMHWLWYRQDGNGAGNANVRSMGIEAFYKAIQQMATQKLSTETTKNFFFK